MFLFTLSTRIVPFLVLVLGGGPEQIHTESARRLYGNRAISVRWPYSRCASFERPTPKYICTTSARSPRDARAGIVQSHLRHVYVLRACDFSNLYNFSRNKIVQVAKPLNPYENLNAASCLRTEAVRKRGYGQDKGSVDQLQVKWNPGIIILFKGSHLNFSSSWWRWTNFSEDQR